MRGSGVRVHHTNPNHLPAPSPFPNKIKDNTSGEDRESYPDPRPLANPLLQHYQVNQVRSA